jgi:hypothetical protein
MKAPDEQHRMTYSPPILVRGEIERKPSLMKCSTNSKGDSIPQARPRLNTDISNVDQNMAGSHTAPSAPGRGDSII